MYRRVFSDFELFVFVEFVVLIGEKIIKIVGVFWIYKMVYVLRLGNLLFYLNIELCYYVIFGFCGWFSCCFCRIKLNL